ncbi:MAG: cell division protein FtsK, partial [Burkholderiales bacterium 28-67-8]
MTFPLGSLRPAGADSSLPTRDSKSANSRRRLADEPEPDPSQRTSDWQRQSLVLAGGVAWLLVLIALLTHSASDAAFSTSGSGGPVHNRAGVLGAWLSDLALFVFGFSVWWAMAIALHRWLRALAQLIRAEDSPAALPEARPLWPDWTVAAGLAMLLAASAALEWTRLYRWESLLPGAHSGGVLGYLLGPASMNLLGFAGSGVLWIALLLAGLSLAFQFSWLNVADAIGERLDAWRDRRAERIEIAEDLRLGEQALREREDVVEVEHQLHEDHEPIVIETPLVDVPKSERVVKERQKPLFTELADTKLPQVDLLDAAPGRMESVSPETLEMTSRLIEKKLKDFGVEVRVVAASPGPVITRYEIEPATGVKGSQVLNLAKDLARSLSLVSIRVVETIPGKTTMALELPNARRQTIHLSEILGSQVYNSAASLLTMGLGKDIIGAPVVADLAKMPHCLVAGTTGSGKSVGINAMILSLLYKAEARDVRLILIDPKMLEMSVYEGIPHLLCPVVTDMKQAASALNWGVGEMERRY